MSHLQWKRYRTSYPRQVLLYEFVQLEICMGLLITAVGEGEVNYSFSLQYFVTCSYNMHLVLQGGFMLAK